MGNELRSGHSENASSFRATGWTARGTTVSHHVRIAIGRVDQKGQKDNGARSVTFNKGRSGHGTGAAGKGEVSRAGEKKQKKKGGE